MAHQPVRSIYTTDTVLTVLRYTQVNVALEVIETVIKTASSSEAWNTHPTQGN